MDRGVNVNAILLSTDYRRSVLVQGGLEIKCTIRVEMIGTAVNQQIMNKYLELVKENYSEPEDELIQGSFENCKDDLHIPQNPAISPTSNKGKKVEKASNNDRDIRIYQTFQ